MDTMAMSLQSRMVRDRSRRVPRAGGIRRRGVHFSCMGMEIQRPPASLFWERRCDAASLDPESIEAREVGRDQLDEGDGTAVAGRGDGLGPIGVREVGLGLEVI